MKFLFLISLIAIVMGAIGLVAHAVVSLKQQDLFYKCLVTFLGVFLALFLNSTKENYSEGARFQSNVYAWKCELEGGISQLKKYQNSVDPKTAAYFKVRCDVAKYLAADKSTYKFGKKGLHELLGVVITRTEAFNMMNEAINNKIATNGTISEGILEQTRNRSDQTRFAYEIALKLVEEAYLKDGKQIIKKEDVYNKVEDAFAKEKAADYKKYKFE